MKSKNAVIVVLILAILLLSAYVAFKKVSESYQRFSDKQYELKKTWDSTDVLPINILTDISTGVILSYKKCSTGYILLYLNSNDRRKKFYLWETGIEIYLRQSKLPMIMQVFNIIGRESQKIMESYINVDKTNRILTGNIPSYYIGSNYNHDYKDTLKKIWDEIEGEELYIFDIGYRVYAKRSNMSNPIGYILRLDIWVGDSFIFLESKEMINFKDNNSLNRIAEFIDRREYERK